MANGEAWIQVLRLLYLCLFSLVRVLRFNSDRCTHRVNFFFLLCVNRCLLKDGRSETEDRRWQIVRLGFRYSGCCASVCFHGSGYFVLIAIVELIKLIYSFLLCVNRCLLKDGRPETEDRRWQIVRSGFRYSGCCTSACFHRSGYFVLIAIVVLIELISSFLL